MKQIMVLLFPILLFSQTLQELIELAQQNKTVQAMQQQRQALQMEYESTQSAYMPQVDIGARYAAVKNETASVPKKGGSAYAQLSYNLYDGGKKGNTYGMYEQNIKAAHKQTQAQKNVLALEVVRYYFDYNTLLGREDAITQQIKQLEAQKKRIASMLRAGTATRDQFQKIVSTVQSAKLDLHQVQLDKQTILHNLTYLTGQQVRIEGGSTIIYSDPEKADRDDIKALQLQTEAAKYEAQIEKSGYYPSVVLDNTFTVYDSDYDNVTYDRSALEEQNIFSVNLSWNIFGFGKTEEAYEAGQKRYLASKLRLEHERQRADTDLALAKKGYRIAKLKIASAKEGLKAAEEAYEVIKSKYQNGLVNNVTYLQALSERVDAQSSLQSALNELEIKKANLLYHGGKSMKEYIQ